MALELVASAREKELRLVDGPMVEEQAAAVEARFRSSLW